MLVRRSARLFRLALLVLFWVMGQNFADAGEARPAWQQDWEKTVQAAKSEGQVTVYVHSTYGPVLSSGAFEKAFPGIRLTAVSGVENDLERRFNAERRAGLRSARGRLSDELREDQAQARNDGRW